MREINAQYMTVIQEGSIRTLTWLRRRRRAEVHARRTENHLQSARLCRHQHLPADLRSRRQLAAGFQRRTEPKIISAHGVVVVVYGTRGALLGTTPPREDLEREEIYITENGCSSSDVRQRTASCTTPIG